MKNQHPPTDPSADSARLCKGQTAPLEAKWGDGSENGGRAPQPDHFPDAGEMVEDCTGPKQVTLQVVVRWTDENRLPCEACCTRVFDSERCLANLVSHQMEMGISALAGAMSAGWTRPKWWHWWRWSDPCFSDAEIRAAENLLTARKEGRAA